MVKRMCMSVLTALILSGTLFAGGGQEQASGEVSMEPAEKQVVEIFWHMTEYESWLRETMKPQFEAENPDIELKITFVNDPENEAVLQSRLAADNLPDIFAVIGGPAIIALQEDKLLDLTQFPGVMENLENFPSNLFDFPRLVRDSVGLSPEGVYGWPTFKVMTGVFYDKNKFAEHGLQPPTTYDEFWTLLEELDGIDDYRFPVAWGNHRWLVFNNFWQVATAMAGPDVSNRLITGDLKFDDPEIIKVWEYYDRIADNGYADPDYKSKEWGQLEADFANLKDGIILQGPWLFNSYPKINPDIELGVVPFPTEDGNNRHWVGFVGDRNFWVAKKPTSSQEAQIRVVEWMTSADFAKRMIQDVNLLSFYQQDYSAYESPVISEMEAKGFPVAPQANNQLDVIIPSGNPSFYAYVWERLPMLTDGKMSPEEFGAMVEEYYGQFRK
jgi:raffinose/stachyose/melibiose transport system substrate-binding protein